MSDRIQVSLNELPEVITVPPGGSMMTGVYALTNQVKICDCAEEVPTGDFNLIKPSPNIAHDYVDEAGQTGYYAGYVYAPTAGTYYFGFDIDDGGDMVLGGSTVSVSGGNSFVHEEGSVYLTSGYHRYVIRYYNEYTDYQGLQVYFGPTQNTQLTEDDTYIPYVPHLIGADLFYPGETHRYQLKLPYPNASHTLNCGTSGLFSIVNVSAGVWDVTCTGTPGSSPMQVEFTAVSVLSGSTTACAKHAFCVADRRKDLPDSQQDVCGCNYSSTPSDGSVKFTQNFGQSPWFSGTPTGQLIIHEDTPSANLFTPGAILYAHPMLRKILNPADKNPVILDEYGQITEYAWNATSGHSVGQDTQVRKNNGVWMEMLTDRTILYYNTSGTVDYLKTPEGVSVTWTELGIEVIRDTNDRIRQIYSLADGLLDIVTDSDTAHGTFYRIEWYAPDTVGAKASGLYTHTGNCVKSFTFRHAAGTMSNNEHMELVEERGTTQYVFRWDYAAANMNWTYTRGYGSNEAVTYAKTTVTSASNYCNTSVISGNTFTPISKTEIIDAGPQGNALLAAIVNGATMSTAQRVADGTNGVGHTAHQVDSLGLSKSHEYDTSGRDILTSYIGFGGTATVLETTAYPGMTSDNFLDFRPIYTEIAIAVNGETNRYVYTSNTFCDDITSGRSATHEESAADGPELTSFETYYPVGSITFSGGVRTTPLTYSAGRIREIRNTDGSMTSHTYSGTAISGAPPSSGTLFVESVTHGYDESCGSFTVVPGKSKREVHYRDVHGNCILTEHFVCPSGGTSFVFIGSDTFAYDTMHRQTSAHMANGKSTSASWICTGPMMEMDEDGIVTSHFYDALKRPIRTERYSPNGTIIKTFSYDLQDNIIAATVSGGSISLSSGFAYDAENRMTALTVPGGYRTTWSYSADRLTTTQTNPDGGTKITKLRTDGTLEFISGTAVIPEFHTSECCGYLETLVHYGTSDGSAYIATKQDAFGNVFNTRRPICDGTELETDASFDSKGYPYYRGESWRFSENYSYDITGASVCCSSCGNGFNRNRVTDTNYVSSAGKVWLVSTETTYADSGSSESETPHLTILHGALVYPFSGNLEAEEFNVDVRGNTASVSMTYDSATKQHTVVRSHPGIANRESSVTRDGLLLTSVTVFGGTMTKGYDALHREISTTDSRGTTTSQYNAAGLVSCIVAPNGGSQTMLYDNMNRVIRLTNALGGTQIRTYDPRGLVLTIRGTAEYPVDFSYNELGQLVSHVLYRNLASGSGDVTQYEVAPSGLVVRKTDPAGNAVRYDYNPQSLVTSVTLARKDPDDNDIEIEFEYNNFRELLSKTYTDSSTADVTIERNALGQEVLRIDAGGTSTMTYNNYSELAAETNSILGTTVTYLRDSFGRNAGIQATRGGVMFYDASYAYDTATGLVNSAVFNTSATFAFTYTPGTDREATVTSPVYVKTNTWQTAIARLSEIRYNRPGTSGALLSKRNYTFDLLSRVTSASRTNDNTTFVTDTFAYNTRSELTSATMNGIPYTYGFDDIGNRSFATEALSVTETYTVNACNQYTESRHGGEDGDAITEFAYDDDGNTMQYGASHFAYDAENRPTHFTGEDDNEAFYAYDAYGRRTWKRVLMNDDTDAALRFLYAGNLLIAEFDANPITGIVTNLRNLFFWDPTASVATKVLASIDYQTSSTPLLRYFLHDAMKNAVNAITPDGTPSPEICYSPFGMPSDTSLAAEFRFTFSGEYFDAETDTTHYLFRDLNHKIGRWPTRDTIGEKGGWNLYAFCENKMINKVEILGLYNEKIKKIERDIVIIGNDLAIYPLLLKNPLFAKGIIDIVNQLNHNLPNCSCYSKIRIWGHGSEGLVFLDANEYFIIENSMNSGHLEITNNEIENMKISKKEKFKQHLLNFISIFNTMMCNVYILEFVECNSGYGESGNKIGKKIADTFYEPGKHIPIVKLYQEEIKTLWYLLGTSYRHRIFIPSTISPHDEGIIPQMVLSRTKLSMDGINEK